MTARFVAAASVSADGYLAGPGGDMSWLAHRPPVEPGTVSRTTEGELRFATTLDDAVELAEGVAGDGVVNVLGASVGDQLLASGRLDEIIVSTVPVLLGGGTRFLDPAGERPALTRLETFTGGPGVTVRYGVGRG